MEDYTTEYYEKVSGGDEDKTISLLINTESNNYVRTMRKKWMRN